MSKPTLYMIPVGLGDEDPTPYLSPEIAQVCATLTHFVVENEKSARRFLKSVAYPHSLNELTLYPLNKHTTPAEEALFLKALKKGESVGMLSEAGCPGVADPGQKVAALAHLHNYNVHPIVGPSSILLALMASGLNGQQFSFHGYLHHDKALRARQMQDIKNRIHRGETQIVMDAPFRNEKLLEALLQDLDSDTKICIATELTQSTEQVKTLTVKQWRKGIPPLHKRPTMFVLGK